MVASATTRATPGFLDAGRPDPGDPVTAFLDQVDATPLCRIGVFGPGAGEALPRLWRRGYAKAQAGRCGHPWQDDGEARHDAILISASACAESALKSVANGLAGLRSGGEVVIERDHLGPHETDSVRHGLLALGLRTVQALRPQQHIVAVKAVPEPRRP